MKLLRPSLEYKQQVLEYKKEFIESGENLAGTCNLQEYDVYEEWMKFVSEGLQVLVHSLNTKVEGRKPIILLINNCLYIVTYVVFEES